MKGTAKKSGNGREKTYFESHEQMVSFLKEAHHAGQLFSIVSWGCAGTSWLAKVLNSHVDILCLHDFPIGYRERGGRDSIEYMQSIYITSYMYTLAGDIHGIPRDSVPSLKRIYGDAFRSAVLVRSPYPRLLSMLATVRFNHGLDNDYSYIDDIAERLNLSGELTWDRRMFIHAVNMLNAIVDEKKYAGDAVFRLEDISVDPEALRALITHISSEKIQQDDSWLIEALRIPPVHSHKDQFGKVISLTDEEKALIPVILSSDAVALYEGLGYDLSQLV